MVQLAAGAKTLATVSWHCIDLCIRVKQNIPFLAIYKTYSAHYKMYVHLRYGLRNVCTHENETYVYTFHQQLGYPLKVLP